MRKIVQIKIIKQKDRQKLVKMSEKEDKEQKNDLEDLKKAYEEIRIKHELPLFEKINEDFHIEKIAGTETDYLIREIRRFMSDKIQNYLRFMETMINPVNAPLFILSLIKNVEEKEKKILSEIHSKLSKIQTSLIELDLKYSEEKEVKFIKENYENWQKIKEELLEIISSLNEKKEKKTRGNNTYFG